MVRGLLLLGLLGGWEAPGLVGKLRAVGCSPRMADQADRAHPVTVVVSCSAVTQGDGH